MRKFTMKIFKNIYVIIFLFLIHKNSLVSAQFEKQNHFIDKHHGIITYDEGPVYIYDSIIYIPVSIGIPTIISTDVETLMNTGKCDIIDELEELMNEVKNQIIIRLPDVSTEYKVFKPEDEILLEGKLHINKNNEKSKRYMTKEKKKNIYQLDHEKYHNYLKRRFPDIYKNNNNSEIIKREKRAIPLIVGAIVVVASIGVLAVANRIDIENQKEKTETLFNNQAKIQKKLNEMTEGVDVLIENQENIILLMSNITSKLNELIKDYNCEKYTMTEKLRFVNSWSSIVPNSFIRALNAILDNKVNIDVIPGEYLKNILRYYPAFSDTIFSIDPNLIYTSSKSKLIKLDRKNLIIDVLISVPRILYKEYGRKYVQKSCHWELYNKTITLKETSRGIMLHNSSFWYSDDNCISKNDVTLCDIRTMHILDNPCFGKGLIWNITDCEIISKNKKPEHEVVQTKNGILVCNNNERITKYKKDSLGITHTSIDYSTNATYYTYKDAETILIDTKHYNLIESGPIINITYYYSLHNHLNNSETLDSFINHETFKHIDRINKLEDLTYYSPYHTLVIYIILGILLLLSILLIIIYKKYNKKTKNQLGYIMGEIIDHRKKLSIDTTTI